MTHAGAGPAPDPGILTRTYGFSTVPAPEAALSGPRRSEIVIAETIGSSFQLSCHGLCFFSKRTVESVVGTVPRSVQVDTRNAGREVTARHQSWSRSTEGIYEAIAKASTGPRWLDKRGNMNPEPNRRSDPYHIAAMVRITSYGRIEPVA